MYIYVHNKNWGRWKTHQVSNSQGLVGCHSVVVGPGAEAVPPRARNAGLLLGGGETQNRTRLSAKRSRILLISFGDGIKIWDFIWFYEIWRKNCRSWWWNSTMRYDDINFQFWFLWNTIGEISTRYFRTSALTNNPCGAAPCGTSPADSVRDCWDDMMWTPLGILWDQDGRPGWDTGWCALLYRSDARKHFLKIHESSRPARPPEDSRIPWDPQQKVTSYIQMDDLSHDFLGFSDAQWVTWAILTTGLPRNAPDQSPHG